MNTCSTATLKAGLRVLLPNLLRVGIMVIKNVVFAATVVGGITGLVVMAAMDLAAAAYHLGLDPEGYPKILKAFDFLGTAEHLSTALMAAHVVLAVAALLFYTCMLGSAELDRAS